MFSKDIVRSDFFLDLPSTSQLLYFHLGMEADDRGYVANAKMLMRMIGATTGDLEQLINKKFVLVRGENLILIKGWRINNSIQPTRIVETKYADDLKKLFYDENNSYTEKPTKKPCQQIVGKMATQVSIGKVSIVEDSNNTDELKGCGETDKPLENVQTKRMKEVIDTYVKEKRQPEVDEADVSIALEIIKKKVRTADEELYLGIVQKSVNIQEACRIAQTKWVDEDDD